MRSTKSAWRCYFQGVSAHFCWMELFQMRKELDKQIVQLTAVSQVRWLWQEYRAWCSSALIILVIQELARAKRSVAEYEKEAMQALQPTG